MLILGIESSCDDTSLSLLRGDPGVSTSRPEVLAHKSYSQEVLLKKWGGVVPEIAARNHMAKLTPLLENVFDTAKLQPQDVDLIGVTTHPGLLGPLLTGLNSAKGLALYHELPILGVNHLYAHLEAIHLTEQIEYPYLGLLVSGGHSLFLRVSSPSDMALLGSTIDDAAGEAFDKGGKLMGLGYPAGPIVDKLAAQGDPKRFEFPVGLKGSKDCSMSFSGLKTSLRQFLDKNPSFIHSGDSTEYTQDLKDVCASYQYAIVQALGLKLKYAQLKNKKDLGRELPLVVGGGVACNSGLRQHLQQKSKEVHFVEPRYCTDNGAMIANYALRTADQAIAFPDCLYVDARGRFINKNTQVTLGSPS
jgi:N6-L-threonylcarbamoyladenine synthase